MSLHASCNHGAPLFVGSPLEDATTGAREGADPASGTNVQSVLPYNDRSKGDTTRLGTSAPLQQLFGSDNGVSEASMTLCDHTFPSGPREGLPDPNELMQDIILQTDSTTFPTGNSSQPNMSHGTVSQPLPGPSVAPNPQ